MLAGKAALASSVCHSIHCGCAVGWGVLTMSMFATVGALSGFICLHALGHIVLFVVAILASGSIDALAVE